MITVQVTYTVNPAFAAQNKENISRFLEDFKQLDTTAFWYHVYVLEDGVTFLHFSSYRDKAIQDQVLQMPSFKAFQQERDDSGLNDSHAVRVLQLVGASSDRLQLA
jgi:quinol monooxygenase YgiN